jgi:hypothetical protein
MIRDKIKLCAYLDEAGEDPAAACVVLHNHNINYVVLREAWTGNICQTSDNGHAKLRTLLEDHDLSPIMIASTLGKVAVEDLPKIKQEQIDSCLNICKFYQCEYLRVYAGELGKPGDNTDIIDDWLSRIQERSLSMGIKCLYEIHSKSSIFKAAEVAKMISNFKNIRILYDPAGLIIRYNFDPFIKHWSLLKNIVDMIDVRDLSIGKGFKVAGYGDSRIVMTIRDAIQSDFKGWLALEPSLGRKHGSATTKSETFAFAVEGLDKILAQL